MAPKNFRELAIEACPYDGFDITVARVTAALEKAYAEGVREGMEKSAVIAGEYQCDLCAKTGPSGHGCCCLDGVADAIRAAKEGK